MPRARTPFQTGWSLNRSLSRRRYSGRSCRKSPCRWQMRAACAFPCSPGSRCWMRIMAMCACRCWSKTTRRARSTVEMNNFRVNGQACELLSSQCNVSRRAKALLYSCLFDCEFSDIETSRARPSDSITRGHRTLERRYRRPAGHHPRRGVRLPRRCGLTLPADPPGRASGRVLCAQQSRPRWERPRWFSGQAGRSCCRRRW